MYPGGTLLQKYFKIRSWVPSPQMPYFKQSTGHTHTTHTRQKQRRHGQQQNTKTLTHTQDTLGGRTPPPQRLEKIPPGFGLVGIIIRNRNIFSARDKKPATSKASERRAVKEDELHAELEQQGQRDGGARRQLSHLQQLADQRRAELQQRVADLVVHLAQRQLKNLR